VARTENEREIERKSTGDKRGKGKKEEIGRSVIGPKFQEYGQARKEYVFTLVGWGGGKKADQNTRERKSTKNKGGHLKKKQPPSREKDVRGTTERG